MWIRQPRNMLIIYAWSSEYTSKLPGRVIQKVFAERFSRRKICIICKTNFPKVNSWEFPETWTRLSLRKKFSDSTHGTAKFSMYFQEVFSSVFTPEKPKLFFYRKWVLKTNFLMLLGVKLGSAQILVHNEENSPFWNTVRHVGTFNYLTIFLKMFTFPLVIPRSHSFIFHTSVLMMGDVWTECIRFLVWQLRTPIYANSLHRKNTSKRQTEERLTMVGCSP